MKKLKISQLAPGFRYLQTLALKKKQFWVVISAVKNRQFWVVISVVKKRQFW